MTPASLAADPDQVLTVGASRVAKAKARASPYHRLRPTSYGKGQDQAILMRLRCQWANHLNRYCSSKPLIWPRRSRQCRTATSRCAWSWAIHTLMAQPAPSIRCSTGAGMHHRSQRCSMSKWRLCSTRFLAATLEAKMFTNRAEAGIGGITMTDDLA